MLSRDWKCLSRACGRVFHSFEKGNPPCTYCGCVKVAWVPGGGHVAKVAPGADATLKSLAADYGLTNMNSASHSRLNRAMPKYEQRRADMPVKHFAPGFSAPVSSLGATCQESEARVDLHGKVATERRLNASRSFGGTDPHGIASMRANTDIAGRHTGRA